MISIVVPSYKEGPNIVKNVAAMREVFQRAWGANFEIVVVIDGDVDNSADELASADFPSVRTLVLDKNLGKGAALRVGFLSTESEYVAQLDADLDIDPTAIVSLLGLLTASSAQAAIGSKLHPESSIAYPPFRRLQSRVYRGVVRVLFNLPLSDTQTGAKVFQAGPLKQTLEMVPASETGFGFDFILLKALHDQGWKIVEGPVTLNYRFSSTVTPRDALSVLSSTIRLWVRNR